MTTTNVQANWDHLYPPFDHSLLDSLQQPFSEEEIKKATFSLGADKATCPDDFNVLFFQKFWNVRNDLIALFHSFYNNNLNMSCLNLAHITLFPKKEGAKKPKELRPIGLLNTPYKIITNPQPILDQLVDPFQAAFLKQRSTLDSVAAAQNLITACSKHKRTGLFFKLDFHKAFDSVDWTFLLKTLEARGFGPKLCQ